MFENFIDDSDKFGYLNQSVVLKFLNDNGFPATIKTLAKYTNLGLMMFPKGKKFRETNQNSRTYYCPLTIIEFMTAYLLNRGEYLEIKTTKRIARFTSYEILAGRIAFFNEGPNFIEKMYCVDNNGPFNYQTYEFLWPGQSLGTSQEKDHRLLMQKIDDERVADIEKCLADFYQSEELGHAAVKYVGLLYRETFQALCNQYLEKILYMPTY